MVERQDLEMTPIGWHTQLGRFMMGPTTASQLKLVESIYVRRVTGLHSSSGLPSVRLKRPD